MTPIRVSLLRYIVFSSSSARESWGTQEREVAAPKARSCFSGATRMGSQNRNGAARRSRGFEAAGRGNWPEAVPKTEGRIRRMTVPRHSPSGLIETDDDHGQPRETSVQLCNAATEPNRLGQRDVQPLFGRTVRFLFQKTGTRRPAPV
jgi:hypothetical protein